MELKEQEQVRFRSTYLHHSYRKERRKSFLDSSLNQLKFPTLLSTKPLAQTHIPHPRGARIHPGHAPAHTVPAGTFSQAPLSKDLEKRDKS